MHLKFVVNLRTSVEGEKGGRVGAFTYPHSEESGVPRSLVYCSGEAPAMPAGTAAPVLLK